MPPVSDLLIDRKRIKAQLVGWRSLALVLIFGAIAFFASGITPGPIGKPRKSYIAHVTIEGIMTDDPDFIAMLKDLRDDKNVKAVIVSLDSPGGTTVGGEEIFIQLRGIAQQKPVVGVMHTLCASACYMASLATDHVVARAGTLTGSIGVLLQSVEMSGLAEKIGIKPITVKSGPYKDVPGLAEPFTEDERKVVSEIVIDAYDRFVAMIVEGRKLDEATVRRIADGRVYTGNQALKLKLIDGLGGEEEVVAWLAQNRKIDPDLDIVDVEPHKEYQSLIDKLSQSMGISIFGRSSKGLDGLVSIWHPSSW